MHCGLIASTIIIIIIYHGVFLQRYMHSQWCPLVHTRSLHMHWHTQYDLLPQFHWTQTMCIVVSVSPSRASPLEMIAVPHLSKTAMGDTQWTHRMLVLSSVH